MQDMQDSENHTRARGLGIEEDMRQAIDAKAIDWQQVFDAIDRYGPIVLEVLKRILLGK